MGAQERDEEIRWPVLEEKPQGEAAATLEKFAAQLADAIPL